MLMHLQQKMFEHIVGKAEVAQSDHLQTMFSTRYQNKIFHFSHYSIFSSEVFKVDERKYRIRLGC